MSENKSIPNLFKVGEIPTNYLTRLESSVISPVIVNNEFIRFIVPSKGFFHNNSEIVFQTEALAEDKFFSMGVGVMSLIDRAVLKTGGKEIQSISDFSHYQSYRSSFLSGESVKQREMVKSGRQVVMTPRMSNSFTISSGTYHNDYESTGLAMINNNEYSSTSLEAPEYTNLRNSPQMTIAIKDLFPLFQLTEQIPTYYLNESNPLTIELTLTPMGKRYVKKAGGGVDNPKINTSEIQLLADFVFYDQDVMERHRRENPTFTVGYVDYQLAKQSITRASGKNQIRSIGGAGRIVTRIFSMLVDDTASDESIIGVQNAEGVLSTITPDDFVASINGSFTTNIKYNGEFLYPLDVNNKALQYNLVSKSQGSPLYVNKEMYDGSIKFMDESVFFEGNQQAVNLRNQFFYQCHRLNDNERINSRGIEIYYQYNQLADQTFTQHVYLELVKTFTIDEDGFGTCYFN